MGHIIHVKLDQEALGYSDEEILNFIKDSEYHVIKKKPEWTNKIRNMLEGWEKIGTMDTWCTNDGPFVPGTYALVWDKDGDVTHPILWNRTFIFGESTRGMYHRLQTHHVALRGKTSNMSDKYRKHLPSINEWAKHDVTANLDKITIWARPHSVSDTDYQYDRDHSVYMEKQAHGFYEAIWGYGPIANTRDKPDYYLIQRCKTFLTEAGYTTK
jgi:hypothetical protein